MEGESILADVKRMQAWVRTAPTTRSAVTGVSRSEPELDLSRKRLCICVEKDHSLCTRRKETEATYLLRKSLESRRAG